MGIEIVTEMTVIALVEMIAVATRGPDQGLLHGGVMTRGDKKDDIHEIDRQMEDTRRNAEGLIIDYVCFLYY